MLKITIEKQCGRTVLILDGKIAGDWVGELKKIWDELVSMKPATAITINLGGVIFADARGTELLRTMHLQGARLKDSRLLIKYMVDEMERRPETGASVTQR